MARPVVVVVGFIGKLPVAGMTLYNLHYILGLQDLGYDVHYVERPNYSLECYDAGKDEMTDDLAYGLSYLQDVLPRFGVPLERISFIDLDGACHLTDWPVLRSALDHAEFLVTLADPVWFEELERCPRRAFVDGDPLFTQAQMLSEGEQEARALPHYDTLFTYGVRIGREGCTVPDAGREWLPCRPVVSTRIWRAEPVRDSLPITTVMNWASAPDVSLDGRTYGHKNREFERIIDLPRRTDRDIALAVGGPAPKQRLVAHGWRLVDPIAATRTIDDYQQFIAASRADLGIAKHGYVASRSGWFSDRSTCYLAAGRPVLHQDTGLGDWLPTGEGVLLFHDLDSLLEAMEALDRDYERHARAARRIAEEHFEAESVVSRMLDDAGYR